MPILKNPTFEPIRCQHGGAIYMFLPGEEKDVFDGYAARHMINRWGQYGLVDLTYGPYERKKFPDYEEFLYEKDTQGLLALEESLQKVSLDFEAYEEGNGDRVTRYRQAAKKNRKLVEARLLKVTELLKGRQFVGKTPQEKADALRAKAQALMQAANALAPSKKEKVPEQNGDNASKSDRRDTN